MPYRTLEKFGEAKRKALAAEAEACRTLLGATPID
jgi:deoxyribodipyrimidine photolyase-related protein